MGRHNAFVYTAWDGCKKICEGTCEEVAKEICTCPANVHRAWKNQTLVAKMYRITRQKIYAEDYKEVCNLWEMKGLVNEKT